VEVGAAPDRGLEVPAVWHGRGGLVLLRNVSDERLGCQQEGRDRRRVLQRDPLDLGRVDDARLHHVRVVVGLVFLLRFPREGPSRSSRSRVERVFPVRPRARRQTSRVGGCDGAPPSVGADPHAIEPDRQRKTGPKNHPKGPQPITRLARTRSDGTPRPARVSGVWRGKEMVDRGELNSRHRDFQSDRGPVG
jgi:hypothetical protein